LTYGDGGHAPMSPLWLRPCVWRKLAIWRNVVQPCSVWFDYF